MELQAEVADLRRRLALVETQWFGRTRNETPIGLLGSLYLDACKKVTLDEATARHWERQTYLLDVKTLLHMARLTRDPTPWKPLLGILDAYIAEGFELEVARDHLLEIAQQLLNLQGFRKIRPRDVMANPLRIKTALTAISR